VPASTFSREGRPLIWGHRGASRDAPENTLAAFQLAAEQGADGIELDAQLCASGEAVVHHDLTLGRTAGRPGLLAEAPWSLLRTLDAGSHKGPRFAGERVPLLAEVLSSTPRTLLVNIELKTGTLDERGLAAEVIRVLRDAAAEERVLLSSFNPLCLARARSLAPEIPRALLFHREQAAILRSAVVAPLVGAAILHPDSSLATPEAVSRWRARGYLVGCWTVDVVDDARRLWESGVSALVTNVPGELRAAFASERRAGLDLPGAR
jgi:glycerophosphoryl diester phosphodiesterase